MTRESEAQLYEVVLKAQQELLQEMKARDPSAYQISLILEKEKYAYRERTNNLNQILHIIGEIHGSLQPIYFVHEHLTSSLQDNPSEWLFLVEGAAERYSRPEEEPTRFYYQELSTLLGIPYEEPLEDILDRTTQSYIRDNTGYNLETLDRYFVEEAASHFIDVTSLRARESLDLNDLCDLMTKTLELKKKIVWPGEYITRLFQLGLLPPSKTKKIDAAWNAFSKLKFQRLCQQYSDRHNLLIVAGEGHLEVFE